MNVASAIPMILNPDYMLSFMVKGSAHITPSTRSLTQWMGGLVLGMTVPLVLSIPYHPANTTSRRTIYTIFGACEVGLSAVMAMQCLHGDSGLEPQALITAIGIFVGILLGRAFCLFVRPECMENPEPEESKPKM